MRRYVRHSFDFRRAIFAVLFFAALGTAPAEATSPQFRRVGTIDAATATANQACNWNGDDLECNSTNPTITATGLVGIGTANPDAPLNIYSSTSAVVADFGSTGSGRTMLRFQANGGTYRYIGADTGGNFNFYDSTGSNILATITNSGNVGIGTAAPTAALEVYNGGITTFADAGHNYNANITVSGTNAGDIEGLIIKAASQQWNLEIGRAAAGYFDIGNGTSPVLTINTNGNVGIGTTAPTGLFDIEGTGNVNFNNSGNMCVGCVTSPDEKLHVAGNVQAAIIKSGYGYSVANFSTDLSKAMTFTPDGIERMRIAVGGNVGIGTASPVANLDINFASLSKAPGTQGLALNLGGTIWSDNSTAASGTAGNAYLYGFGNTTFAASNPSVTTTQAATVAISGSPVAGANEALSNASALYIPFGSISNGGSVTNAYGVNANSPYGATNVFGGSFTAWNIGGAETTATGIAAGVSNLSGTITNAYGVNIGNVQGTNHWSLYASDASSPSYFAGSVGIGTTAPAASVKADINGLIKVAGTGSEPCTAAQVGAMRYNPTGNYFELCSYP